VKRFSGTSAQNRRRTVARGCIMIPIEIRLSIGL
jgi:hypothetical protein